MGKVKVGTSLDSELLRQAQQQAYRDNKPLNQILEEALTAYLKVKHRLAADVVTQTFASVRVSRETLESVLAEDLYDT